MKFFIRKRSETIKKAAFGSALLLVSAIAVLYPSSIIGADKMPVVPHEEGDSISAEHFGARLVFEKLHNSALEILPVSTRLDMLDYWDVDSVYKASNAMEGLSWLEKVTPDYLKVYVSAISSLEIRILPEKKSKIVMTVYTVGDNEQAEDSQIKFYDEALNELPTEKYFIMPQLKDFFDIPKGSATKMKEIEQMIPFPTMAFTANADNDNLEGKLTVEKYIDEDDWNIAKLFVKPSITFLWQKGKYKLQK